MSDRRHSREDALDRVQYLDLYRAATRIDDSYQRLAAIVLVLCTGRLAMRIGEVLHLHEGWINWKQGCIKIPSYEPCACRYCWDRAEKNFDPEEDDANDVVEFFYRNRWSPKTEMGSRVVPFNWSTRITAALIAFFSEHSVIDENYKWTERTMKNHILSNAEFLKPGDVLWHGLRATGLTFWADANIGTKAVRDAGGHMREKDSIPYRSQSPQEASNKMRQAVGKDPVWFDTTDFVALDPRPIGREPFDPRDVDPLERHSLYDRGPVENPRDPNLPEDVEYDRTRFDSLAAERDPPTPSERKAFVRRIEAEREGSPETDRIDPYLEAATNEDERLPGQSRMDEFREGLGGDEEGTVTSSEALKVAYIALVTVFAWWVTIGTSPMAI